MGIVENYKEYRKYKPSYKNWEKERANQEAKRINYIKKYGVDSESSKADIERAKAILNAVDVMDEFSQSRAEEMEMTIKSAGSTIGQLSSYVGFGLSGLSVLFSKKIKTAVENISDPAVKNKFSPLLLIPVVLYAAPVLIVSVALSIFGAKKETEASKLGRAEAITKKLDSPKQFAVLTDEQKRRIADIEKDINITKTEVKNENKTTKGLGIIKSIKTIFIGDKENKNKLDELNERFKKDAANAESDAILSEKQIEEAKKR